MKKRLVTAILGGTAVASLAFASASVLSVDGGTVQAGVANGLACDTNGVKTNWGLETKDNTVRSVRISGIDAACDGAEMWVKTNTMSGDPAKVTLDDSGQATVRFTAPFPTPESLNAVRIWIEG